jgi:serine/threonine protein kinase
MTPERRQQAQEIFNSLIKRQPEERAAFLAQACAGDDDLRNEVESLIAAHEKTDNFSNAPTTAAAVSLTSEKTELQPGQSLGSYEILSFLSRGGMGEVYLAQDKRLRRKVALKILPAAYTKDPNRLSRFEQEAIAASALNHPNILTIYEIAKTGSIDGGPPVQFADHVAVAPSISPDGKSLAYLFPESTDPFAQPNRIAVVPFPDGSAQPLTFIFQGSGTVFPVLHWANDGKSIRYSVNANNVSNLWSQPLDGSPAKQITAFKDSLITGFAWSPDGKQLACTRGVLLRDAVLITDAK